MAGTAEAPLTIAQRLEACFRSIERERMGGIPILNPRLKVEAVGARHFAAQWLLALVTPWFISIVLLPTPQEDGAREPKPAPLRVGDKRIVAFPAGPFEFIAGFEPSLGSFAMCSLFSPVLEFADQETAVAAAEAALAALFDADTGSEPDMEMIWRGDLPAQRVAAGAEDDATEGAVDDAAAPTADEPPPAERLGTAGEIRGRRALLGLRPRPEAAP